MHKNVIIQQMDTPVEYSMNAKLLTEQHLEFLNLKGGCTGSSESTLIKMSYCWKSHVAAHITKQYVFSSMVKSVLECL